MKAKEYVEKKLELYFTEDVARKDESKEIGLFTAKDLEDAYGAGFNEGQSKWVPVSESLPDKETSDCYSKDVLVLVESRHGKRTIHIDFYDYVEEEWFSYGDEVTHWAPIPEYMEGGIK